MTAILKWFKIFQQVTNLFCDRDFVIIAKEPVCIILLKSIEEFDQPDIEKHTTPKHFYCHP